MFVTNTILGRIEFGYKKYTKTESSFEKCLLSKSELYSPRKEFTLRKTVRT